MVYWKVWFVCVFRWFWTKNFSSNNTPIEIQFRIIYIHTYIVLQGSKNENLYRHEVISFYRATNRNYSISYCVLHFLVLSLSHSLSFYSPPTAFRELIRNIFCNLVYFSRFIIHSASFNWPGYHSATLCCFVRYVICI